MRRILSWFLVGCGLPGAAFGGGPVAVEVAAGRVSHGVVSGVVDVPAERLLAIVTDCATSDRWFPDTTATRREARGDGGIRCAGTTDLPWPISDRTWAIDVDPYGAVVRFDLVAGSGNLQSLSGSYTLVPVDPQRTHLTYEASIDLGFWVPPCLAEWASRQLLPGILTGVEQEYRRNLAVGL